MNRLTALVVTLLLGLFVFIPPAQATYKFTTINPPSTLSNQPTGINDNGQVVGISFYSGDYNEVFLYSGGVFTITNFPGPAYGINDSGQIAGFFSGWVVPGAAMGLVETGGVFTTLNVPNASNTYAFGINNSGQVAGYYGDAMGYHGFMESGGVFTTINYHHRWALPLPMASTITARYLVIATAQAVTPALYIT